LTIVLAEGTKKGSKSSPRQEGKPKREGRGGKGRKRAAALRNIHNERPTKRKNGGGKEAHCAGAKNRIQVKGKSTQTRLFERCWRTETEKYRGVRGLPELQKEKREEKKEKV